MLALAGLTVLYAQPITTRLLNDDYLFLEEARTRPLVSSLGELGALGNYYRPLSRQIYFEVLDRVGGGHPLVFHVVDYALFLVALGLLADLLATLVALPGVIAGVACFALLPFQRVNLTWVSCSQDLLALAGTLGAFALYRRGRMLPALACFAAAITSKESAWPAPLAFFVWDALVERRPAREAARRAGPFMVLGLVWAGVVVVMRERHAARAPLAFDVSSFAAAYAHMLQSLVGLEHLPGGLVSLLHHGPSIVPLVLLGAAAYGLARLAPPREPAETPPGDVLRWAGLWLILFGAVTGPVAYSWSAYYYTLAAVGAAVLAGVWLRRARPAALAAWVAALLWIHAGASETRAFAIVQKPWVWTSHLTSYYFQRVARLTDRMSRQLVVLEPAPPADARFFFAALPTFHGFQMGNGALVRALYRKPDMRSYFYSQFSESTASDHPSRFFYWNGDALEPMYARASDPFFQVGSDLLLLGHLDGAAHAFHRGLAAGENRLDLLYWLGWTDLWRGRRDDAETAWKTLGFRDDSLLWMAHLRAAHNALVDGDTLNSRRNLITAIQYGVGRPEAHAVLGDLLARDHMKYALLELKAATWLNPEDWLARRELVRGLADIHLDDAARAELRELVRTVPAAARDSNVVSLSRELDRRASPSSGVAEF